MGYLEDIGSAIDNMFKFTLFTSIATVVLGIALLVGVPTAWYFGSTAEMPCVCQD